MKTICTNYFLPQILGFEENSAQTERKKSIIAQYQADPDARDTCCRLSLMKSP